ncbi:acetyl-CoA C-acetyltransferase [Geothrix sp. PMB-07]|uniref:acetyl-CoA C-acetyltransferase n=1 Tax=Geothrix sp. PMB-07 TaxID=3068640 RepID=UPI002741A167|nr:acetyl-CoA C-acetyltransferase [Geothrix sp. PMB-07]WLT31156.1 acetyl-CoA C-acetyltransferase [Geothrix sp. PMB-07]
MSAYILSATRTAVASFGGALKPMNAVDLGALAIREALVRSGVESSEVGDVVMGNVLQAGSGQNVARLSALKAGLLHSTPAHTPNQVCGSGLKAVALGAQSILMDDAAFVVAGGTESMSNAPYLLPAARWGARMGNAPLIDSMIQDGLWCGHGDTHMGITAENVAAKHGITREAQDASSLVSQQRAAAAQAAGAFDREIFTVTLSGKKGDVQFNRDEYIKADATAEGLAKLKPAFKKDGTVTAGNASGINDGAAALVLASEAAAKAHKPIARILGFAQAGVDPATMGLGPVPAIQKLLKKTGVKLSDIDLFELNEAFAAQSLGVLAELPEIDPAKVNLRGGAIAIGHPIGASGTRILVTLLHLLQDQNKKLGIAALCIGGGQGVAMLVERV